MEIMNKVWKIGLTLFLAIINLYYFSILKKHSSKQTWHSIQSNDCPAYKNAIYTKHIQKEKWSSILYISTVRYAETDTKQQWKRYLCVF